MNKKVKIVLIILLCLAVLGGIGFVSVKAIQKVENDKKTEQKLEKEIVDNFDAFKEAIGDFNIEWSTYHTVIEADINANTVYQYDGWIISLDSYTEAIDKVEEVSSVFKKDCVNKYYANTSVKNKCDAFMVAYEKAMNSYVSDIEGFNTKIDELNEKRDEKDKLEKYELKYKKVDLNNDKEYSEIEVEKETSETE